MADISQYLAAILSAVYGEDVRGSIHDAIEIINDVSEVVLSTGTAITGPTSSSTGFYEDSLYLNTDTYELWKCVGTDTWSSQGILKGADGSPGVPGEDGNRWYRGVGISGKAVNPTVYSGSGITDANPNDFYLNPSEGAVYHCVTGGDASTATWSYDFTMTGGGGGGSIVTWTQIQTSTGATKIAEIDIDGTTTDVYAPSGGGGGASSLDDLSDVTITGTPTQGQILIANSSGIFENASAPADYDMINNANAISLLTSASADPTDDDVASGYAISNWSNTDTITLLTTASQNTDTIGAWNDTWKTDGDRSGWLWDSSLYDILSDDDVEIEPVFDVAEEEAVGILAYRIDDDIDQTIGSVTVHGGAIAIKLNAPIQSASGIKLGFKLKRQRTKRSNFTVLT